MKSQKGFAHIVLLGVFLVLGVGFLVLGLGMQTKTSGTTVTRGAINDDQLANTLLTGEEIAKATNMEGKMLSEIVQFNDALFDEAKTYQYSSMVGRESIAKPSGDPFVSNALVLFDSNEKAAAFIQAKAREAGNANVTKSSDGIPTLTVVQAGSADDPGSVTIRFVIDSLAARVQVFGEAETMKIAETLAVKQKEKIEQLLRGAYKAPPQNTAMKQLPSKLSGYTSIGKASMSMEDWMGASKELIDESIPGFVSGGLTRFKQENNPNAVDVVVMEFASEIEAKAYQDTFFTEGIHLENKTSEKLDLPESLNEFSVARTSDDINELMAIKGTYLYDISILPMGEEFDKDKEGNTLIKVSEEILRSRS